VVILSRTIRTKTKISIMPAYIIVEISIEDPKDYEEYKKLTPATIAAYDGRFAVRGGQTETLEGDWQPERIVVLEFPTVERAKEWWSSDMYSKAKTIRQRSATTKMIVVPGA
jgi:uncharacterized protein (DUF1330 family)